MKIEIQDSNKYGKLDSERLRILEIELRCALPTPYRDFLMSHNGGFPKGEDRLGEIKHFFGLHDGPKSRRLPDPKTVYDGYFLEGLWPIADDPKGKLITIWLRGDERGAVYRWDQNNFERPGDALKILAPDFDKYVQGLSWYWAVAKNRLDEIEVGIQSGLPLNEWIYSYYSLLTMSLKLGKLRVAKLLIESGAKLKPEDLPSAVYNGNPHTVEFLLDEGLDVNYAPPSSGFTALMTAVNRNDLAIVRVLLDRGANVNAVDKYGKRPPDFISTPEMKSLLEGAVK